MSSTYRKSKCPSCLYMPPIQHIILMLRQLRMSHTHSHAHSQIVPNSQYWRRNRIMWHEQFAKFQIFDSFDVFKFDARLFLVRRFHLTTLENESLQVQSLPPLSCPLNCVLSWFSCRAVGASLCSDCRITLCTSVKFVVGIVATFVKWYKLRALQQPLKLEMKGAMRCFKGYCIFHFVFIYLFISNGTLILN